MSLVVLAAWSCPTLRPHGLYPTRFLCPWNSPGNNTGVGCHALLHGIFPTQGSNPLLSAALANRFFATKFTWEALYMMYGIWHNFKRWKGDYTLWGFLLVLCTFTHSSWVSLSLPNMCSLFLKATTTVLCGFLASMEPKGQGGGLPKWDRIDLQHNTVAFMESIRFFYLFYLRTPFSLLGYPAFLLSSLNRYLPFPSH